MCLASERIMARQNTNIITMEEVEYQADLHHSDEVYWDVAIDDLPYLGIFPEGDKLDPLVDPEDLWLPDDEIHSYIIPDCEEEPEH
jgi:hypothetical protein